MDDLWVVVPGWGRFQHYGKRRDAPWIKQYNEIVHRDEYLGLTLAERGLLHGIWSLYALSGGLLRVASVRSGLACRPLDSQWKALNDAGFIQLSASKPASEPASKPASTTLAPHALARVEKRREEPLTPQSGVTPRKRKANPRALGTNPRAIAKAERVDVHERLLEAARDIAANWNGGGSDLFDDQLDALERNHHDKLGYLERDELWADALNRPGKPTDPDDELF